MARPGWSQSKLGIWRQFVSDEVSGYLIIHYQEKEISISAVCFMRSLQCQTPVSKQPAVNDPGSLAFQSRVTMEMKVPGRAHDPCTQVASGLQDGSNTCPCFVFLMVREETRV